MIAVSRGPSWARAAIWLAAALLLQVTGLVAPRWHQAVPSAVLIAVLWFAVRSDPRRAGLYGLIAGLCEDAIAGTTGGAWTLSTTVVAVLASRASAVFFADSIPLIAVLAFIATLVRDALFWSVMALEGYPAGLGTLHAHAAVRQGVLNAVVAAALVAIVRRISAGRMR